MKMRYGTFCSGIEAPSVAWGSRWGGWGWPGWELAFTSEIDDYCSALLGHHYPGVPNLGDMEAIDRDELRARFGPGSDEPVRLVCAGTPCQSFSVAGLRAGMDDPRGNLALVFLRLVDALRPEWVVWENVPGVRSSSGGRDFGAFLGALGQLGYGWAYRSFDARYFGLAQRRERVFVVACAGGCWQRAAAVLLERAGLRGDPAPGRAEGAHIAALTAHGVGTCGADDTQAQAGHLIAAVDLYNQAIDGDTTHTLRATGGGDGVPSVMAHGQGGAEIAEDGAPTLTCFDPTQVTHPANRSRCAPGSPAPALARGAHPPAVCFQTRVARNGRGTMVECSPALNGANAGATSDMRPCVAYNIAPAHGQGADLEAREAEYAAALTAIEPTRTDRGTRVVDLTNMRLTAESGAIQASQDRHNRGYGVLDGWAVRRLTPVECERLQGFPDGYTAIDFNGKPGSDSRRYRALGNSMPVPVVRWIGERIALLEEVCAA